MAKLFVYGTLLSGATCELGAEARHCLTQSAILIGAATMTGRLVDLGAYPGLEIGAEAGRAIVIGEAYELCSPIETLAWLDCYEDIDPQAPASGPYQRLTRTADLLDGRAIECWAYVLTAKPTAAAYIASGCWLTHVADARSSS